MIQSPALPAAHYLPTHFKAYVMRHLLCELVHASYLQGFRTITKISRKQKWRSVGMQTNSIQQRKTKGKRQTKYLALKIIRQAIRIGLIRIFYEFKNKLEDYCKNEVEDNGSVTRTRQLLKQQIRKYQQAQFKVKELNDELQFKEIELQELRLQNNELKLTLGFGSKLSEDSPTNLKCTTITYLQDEIINQPQ